MNKIETIKTKISEATSKRLIAHLHAKHGVAGIKSMSIQQFRAAKKEAEDELKASKQTKKIETQARKEEEPRKDIKREADRNIIMQMRKISDYNPGKYPVRVSPVRSVHVHTNTAKKVLDVHDTLPKPNDKRKFRISLVRKLRKLNENAEFQFDMINEDL
jgi:hypothetical protein